MRLTGSRPRAACLSPNLVAQVLAAAASTHATTHHARCNTHGGVAPPASQRPTAPEAPETARRPSMACRWAATPAARSQRSRQGASGSCHRRNSEVHPELRLRDLLLHLPALSATSTQAWSAQRGMPSASAPAGSTAAPPAAGPRPPIQRESASKLEGRSAQRSFMAPPRASPQPPVLLPPLPRLLLVLLTLVGMRSAPLILTATNRRRCAQQNTATGASCAPAVFNCGALAFRGAAVPCCAARTLWTCVGQAFLLSPHFIPGDRPGDLRQEATAVPLLRAMAALKTCTGCWLALHALLCLVA
eukprot:144860-Chlamydomonas_euryale.AAC.4